MKLITLFQWFACSNAYCDGSGPPFTISYYEKTFSTVICPVRLRILIRPK